MVAVRCSSVKSGASCVMCMCVPAIRRSLIIAKGGWPVG
jgi:hypothetical protein